MTNFVSTGTINLNSINFSMPTAELASHSFHKGTVPFCFKHASVVPLLEKPSTDKHACPFPLPAYFQLDFISKILECLCLFLAHTQPHILSSVNFKSTPVSLSSTPFHCVLSVHCAIYPWQLHAIYNVQSVWSCVVWF